SSRLARLASAPRPEPGPLQLLRGLHHCAPPSTRSGKAASHRRKAKVPDDLPGDYSILMMHIRVGSAGCFRDNGAPDLDSGALPAREMNSPSEYRTLGVDSPRVGCPRTR